MAYAERGDAVMTMGSIARGLLEAGHARLARAGIWVTNEKGLLGKAGLGAAEGLLCDALGEGVGGTKSLVRLLDRVDALVRPAV